MSTFPCPGCGLDLPEERRPRFCLACGWKGDALLPEPPEPERVLVEDTPAQRLARTTDPETSKTSARAVESARHKSALLTAARGHPGSCRGELAEITGLEQYEASKRLSDLVNDKLVYYEGSKRYAGSGRQQQRVWPVEQPEQRGLV